MKLSSDDETLAENKVLVLYIMNKVAKPLSNDALFKLVYSIADMNYFYFQQFLLDLLENDYIVNYIQEEQSLYELTKKGIKALSLTENLIPGIVKLKIDSNFKEELNIIEDEYSITAEYIPESETQYSIKCKITENNKTIFEIQTFAGSREQAKNIVDNWKSCASDIYPKILNLLDSQN